MGDTKGYGLLVSKVLSSQEPGSAKKITNKFFLNWVTMFGHH